ncbi:histidine ammonia-lyase [Gigaspora rosea]|uniref:Histidine ammonia-lyase n=1 Tax=Gigaspora rosea TaxID=44941 RepID=A0A397VHD5_9GLOM|nr:histidine ammonia-lyase [Gigaspora rosea]
MFQNLYRASQTLKLQHFNLRISTMRYAINIFNRGYVTKQQYKKDDERSSFKDLNLQVARDLQKLNPIEIRGENLTIEDVIQVARFHHEARLTTDEVIQERIIASNNYITKAIDEGKVIYGVNTCFGALAKKILSAEEISLLQDNLIWDHKCSIGKKLPTEHVRAGMLIRANALTRGVSGIRLELIERILKFLNADLIPVVREYGSIGASGDLIPLAQIAGAIIGIDPSFKVSSLRGEIDAHSALEKLALKPIKLGPKEGLALMNGSSVSTGIATLCIYEVDRLFSLILHVHSFFIQALQGSIQAFDPFVHKHKPHKGQIRVANKIVELIDGSKFLDDKVSSMKEDDIKLIQDRYSIRCLPQYLGVIADIIAQARKRIEIEINAVTDNPLIDVDRQMIFHQGNFLGQSDAISMDQIRHSLGLIVKHIDTQIALLVSPEFSNNLPPSLIGNPKTNILVGLKGLQICANSIMPILLHQGNHITHLYPTHAEQYNQNINSQSFASANLTWNSIEIMKHYLAISLIFAVQSIELRTFAIFQNYNARAYLSPKLIPLYKTIYEILGCEMSVKKPLIRNNYEQPLDSYVHKIVNDLNDSDGSILNLMV